MTINKMNTNYLNDSLKKSKYSLETRFEIAFFVLMLTTPPCKNSFHTVDQNVN